MTPARAEFQVHRVANARGTDEKTLALLISAHAEPRQFGILREPRVNVLELNLDLDREFSPQEVNSEIVLSARIKSRRIDLPCLRSVETSVSS